MNSLPKTMTATILMLATQAVGLAQAETDPKWGNASVEFQFDPQKGTYALTDKRDGAVVIKDAVFHINQYASNQKYAFTWKAEPVADELGKGQKITLEGKVPDQPSLILEVFLYDDRSFVALNLGTDNPMDDEYRVRQFSPLKGVAFPGAEFTDYKTLDGEGGAALTKVSTEDVAKSKNNLLVTFGAKGARKRSLVIGGLSYHEFQKNAAVTKRADALEVELTAEDPVGKRVDGHSRYVFDDRFYIDFGTDNRFEALEKYGDALRLANHVDIAGVTVPILNFWYAYIDKFGADEFSNNSVGTLQKLEEIAKTGFLKYSPVGLRLEPDSYAKPNNQQGWWDDKHWQMYRGGQLLAPYETMVKWGKKVREMGGVPFMYNQTARRSEDYCLQFPDHLLFNSPTKLRSKGRVGWWGREGDAGAAYWTYDFTDPGFVQHMKDVYQNLRNAEVQGIKFDYPDTGWAYDGGFEDKYATTTSAYRAIFKLAYEGLGPGRDVQERIPPFGDICLGVVTTQRTEGDNDRVYPGRVAKTGLRWYKNRMVVNYDCDPINPAHVYPSNSRDGWQAAITMTYTTSGRLEIGKYFEKMTPEMLFDLSRAVPLLDAPTRSARPIDAFQGRPYPEVYDFERKGGGRIVTLFNQRIEGEEWPTDVLAYWTLNKQFVPKKMVPATIGVSLGDKNDDGGLGLDPAKSYYVFDFWNWRFVGKLAGGGRLEQDVRPGEARVLAVHAAEAFPQLISTSRHLLQGHLDIVVAPAWNAEKAELGATSKFVGGEAYKVAVAGNGYVVRQASAGDVAGVVSVLDAANGIYEVSFTVPANADAPWKISFAQGK